MGEINWNRAKQLKLMISALNAFEQLRSNRSTNDRPKCSSKNHSPSERTTHNGPHPGRLHRPYILIAMIETCQYTTADRTGDTIKTEKKLTKWATHRKLFNWNVEGCYWFPLLSQKLRLIQKLSIRVVKAPQKFTFQRKISSRKCVSFLVQK